MFGTLEVEQQLLSGDDDPQLRAMFGDQLYEELQSLSQQINAVANNDALQTATHRQPPVYLLPGIMGSRLWGKRALFNDLVWFDPIGAAAGGLTRLTLGSEPNPIFASGLFAVAYTKIKLSLRNAGYEVRELAYDWRLSIDELGERAFGQLLVDGAEKAILVCHSMGGLVARRMAQLDHDGKRLSKVITLGTPNYGSYSPVEIFSLTHSMLRNIARIDLTNNAHDLAQDVVRHFPGLVEMLPSPDKRPNEKYFSTGGWPTSGVRPLKRVLDAADRTRVALAEPDQRFIQIIGINQTTIQTARQQDNQLVFSRSLDGDGTVPRDLAEMGSVPRYYVEGEHGNLANVDSVIEAVKDLMETGSTQVLASTLPDRSVREERATEPDEISAFDLRDQVDATNADCSSITEHTITGSFVFGGLRPLVHAADNSATTAHATGRRSLSAVTYSSLHNGVADRPQLTGDQEITKALRSSPADRDRMARKILEFEARVDAHGRLAVYYLHPEDGGGRYEVAGINERYHKEEADHLVALIESGQHEQAEEYAVAFIAGYTDVADRWCGTLPVEFYLRDCIFNRGPGGAAWIVQHAVGVTTDRVVGPQTRAAIAAAEVNSSTLLDKLRASREVYERRKRNESSRFWLGLVNRWNKARAFALTFAAETPPIPLRSARTAVEIDNRERILNCVASEGQPDDWSMEVAFEADVVRSSYYPEEYDLREDWWQIGDQGRTGSCVGWATADSVLRWHFARLGSITEDQHLSIRFIWMAAKETDVFNTRPTTFIEDAGTSLKAALDVARKLGCVTDAVLPFERNTVFRGTERSFYARASRQKIASYHNLTQSPEAWRQWIYQCGPILTRLDVDDAFYNAAQTEGRLDDYNLTNAQGGHAVAIVGYTRDRFIVRNSWGKAWGDRGFAFASNDYARKAFTEAYGVTV